MGWRNEVARGCGGMGEACFQEAIGVFDSGVGGLTVFRQLAHLLPGEHLVYLGDTGRVPYGTRSPEAIRRYVLEDARFLVAHGVKLLVVACHTSSAVALAYLQRQMEVPVVGVIEPGVRRALELTRGKVGVIGTPATVRSGAYSRLIRRLRPEVRVVSRACPLFVPLAEEGWMSDGAEAREGVRVGWPSFTWLTYDAKGWIPSSWVAPTTPCSRRPSGRPWVPRWLWWTPPARPLGKFAGC